MDKNRISNLSRSEQKQCQLDRESLPLEQRGGNIYLDEHDSERENLPHFDKEITDAAGSSSYNGTKTIASSQGTMEKWVNALRPFNPELANRLNERREDGFKAVERLGMPSTKRVVLPLGVFVASPNEHLRQLGAARLYINLLPLVAGLDRHRQNDLPPEGVLEFIHLRIPTGHYDKYSLILGEYIQNYFGGTILINSGGSITIELKRGVQQDLATGQASPEYVLYRDGFSGVFHYSASLAQDRVLQQVLQRTLAIIPDDNKEPSKKGTKSPAIMNLH